MTPKATHNPNEVHFEPVTKREMMQTPRGPVPVTPGEDVKIFDGSDCWPNSIEDFMRRYGANLDQEARECIKKYYPDVEIP